MGEIYPRGAAVSPREPAGEPDAILLKNGIAVLAPTPIARGAFGQVHLGKVLNPLGLLAERIVWGEENPKWLGIEDIPFEDSHEDPSQSTTRLPAPILTQDQRKRVYDAAARMWGEYRERRRQDPVRAEEESKDWWSLVDPLLREERAVAVKVLRPPAATEESPEVEEADAALRRFIRENDLLRALVHPSVVRRFGLLRDPRLGWCLLLEYIEGDTLDEHLGRREHGRLPYPEAARLARELGGALEYVHAKGIVHRDLKPGNIMIRKDSGRAVIMDFGIGKWIERSQTLTMAGARLGTPRYMAPEQARGNSPVTAAIDVYQLSTLLFEMVTGRPAYEGLEQASILERLADSAQPHPTYVHELVPAVSQEFETLIEVGREKDPALRWTIAEFNRRLDAVMAQGVYEKGKGRKTFPKDELLQALAQTSLRKKELNWKERMLRTRLHFVDLESRMEAAAQALSVGRHAEVRKALDALKPELEPLPARYAPLRKRLVALDVALARAAAKDEAVDLLSQAEADFAAGRFWEVGGKLDHVTRKLTILSRKTHADLHRRHRALSRPFDALHRSFVELFLALRQSFVVPAREKYRELLEAYGAQKPVDVARIDAVLEQVASAARNLATLDASKVGRAAHQATAKELIEQHAALEDLRRRVGSGREMK